MKKIILVVVASLVFAPINAMMSAIFGNAVKIDVGAPSLAPHIEAAVNAAGGAGVAQIGHLTDAAGNGSARNLGVITDALRNNIRAYTKIPIILKSLKEHAI